MVNIEETFESYKRSNNRSIREIKQNSLEKSSSFTSKLWKTPTSRRCSQDKAIVFIMFMPDFVSIKSRGRRLMDRLAVDCVPEKIIKIE